MKIFFAPWKFCKVKALPPNKKLCYQRNIFNFLNALKIFFAPWKFCKMKVLPPIASPSPPTQAGLQQQYTSDVINFCFRVQCLIIYFHFQHLIIQFHFQFNLNRPFTKFAPCTTIKSLIHWTIYHPIGVLVILQTNKKNSLHNATILICLSFLMMIYLSVYLFISTYREYTI